MIQEDVDEFMAKGADHIIGNWQLLLLILLLLLLLSSSSLLLLLLLFLRPKLIWHIVTFSLFVIRIFSCCWYLCFVASRQTPEDRRTPSCHQKPRPQSGKGRSRSSCSSCGSLACSKCFGLVLQQGCPSRYLHVLPWSKPLLTTYPNLSMYPILYYIRVMSCLNCVHLL